MGLEISVQGEKEFKASLSEINAALRVNNAELEAVKAAYEGNEDSIDALVAKQDVLDRTMLTQKEKLSALESALKKTGEKYGETDTRTLRLKESLIKAQTEFEKTRNELEKTSESLDNTGEKTSGLSGSLFDMAEAAGVDIPPALSTLTEKLDSSAAAGAALVGVLGGIVAGLAKATISTAETAKEIEVMSQTTGLSVEKIQELQYASSMLGIEEDEVQDKLKDLTSAMRDARDGSEDMSNAFKELRVKVVDAKGNLKDSGTVFYEVVDALGEIENKTERDALAMQIFGEEAQKLNPIFEAGIEGLNGFAQEANELGYVMDSGAIEKFSGLNEAMAKMEKQSEALKQSFAVALLPILTTLFQAISAIPTPVLQTLIVFGGMVATIIAASKAIKSVTDTGNTFIQFLKGFDVKALKTTAIIVGIVASLIALGAIIAVIMGKKDDLQSALNSINSTTGEIKGSVLNVQNGYSNTPRLARGTNFHAGGLALVGEEGPELVNLPRGAAVYPASKTRSMLSGTTENNYYVTIDAKNVKEFNDVVKIAQQKKSSIRQGVIRK